MTYRYSAATPAPPLSTLNNVRRSRIQTTSTVHPGGPSFIQPNTVSGITGPPVITRNAPIVPQSYTNLPVNGAFVSTTRYDGASMLPSSTIDVPVRSMPVQSAFAGPPVSKPRRRTTMEAKNTGCPWWLWVLVSILIFSLLVAGVIILVPKLLNKDGWFGKNSVFGEAGSNPHVRRETQKETTTAVSDSKEETKDKSEEQNQKVQNQPAADQSEKAAPVDQTAQSNTTDTTKKTDDTQEADQPTEAGNNDKAENVQKVSKKIKQQPAPAGDSQPSETDSKPKQTSQQPEETNTNSTQGDSEDRTVTKETPEKQPTPKSGEASNQSQPTVQQEQNKSGDSKQEPNEEPNKEELTTTNATNDSADSNDATAVTTKDTSVEATTKVSTTVNETQKQTSKSVDLNNIKVVQNLSVPSSQQPTDLTPICNDSYFLYQGRCIRCPSGSSWDGSNCIGRKRKGAQIQTTTETTTTTFD